MVWEGAWGGEGRGGEGRGGRGGGEGEGGREKIDKRHTQGHKNRGEGGS